MKLRLVKYYDEWKFVFPKEMESVFDEYWDAVDLIGQDEKECQRVLKSIIKRFPETHLDAYNHMSISLRNQGKTTESFHYALTSYLIGKNSFPKEFNQKKDKISWLDIDNRPFLRACSILGYEYLKRNSLSRATEIFNENLNYNPNDNQGVRYELLTCHLSQKNFTAFKLLMDKYNDDYSVDFLYGRIVYDILQNEGKMVDKLIVDAKRCNPNVIIELAKDVHTEPPPITTPWGAVLDGIPSGSELEAYDYWKRNKRILNLKKVKSFFKFAEKNYA